MKEKNLLKKKTPSDIDIAMLEKIECEVSVKIEDKEFKKLESSLSNLESEKGGTNFTSIWKEVRKAYPKQVKPLPTGVMNMMGKVITNPKEKKLVTLDHFAHRMRKREVKDEVTKVVSLKYKLFEKRLKESKEKKSPPFQLKELEKVLKSLKGGKSKDPDNYVSELFKEGVIGSDLKGSLLLLMNKIKSDQVIPECLRKANITILHKKGNKLDLNNWRGIFVCSVIRKILMKLVHGRTYEQVACSMTDAQIGAKRNQSVRNHLFVLNCIISDVMSSNKKTPVDLNIMDFKQMFDAEELPTVLNSLYEAGGKDDMLYLINEANKSVTFAVKTPTGMTEQKIIHNKIISPLMSINMVDSFIDKMALATGNTYTYKNKVNIPPLIMQDDTLAVSTCGIKH